jgi:hypothetical protein
MNPIGRQRPLLSQKESAEQKRLADAKDVRIPWKKWGPYLSERQWGTVREDYVAMAMPGTTSRMTRPDPVPITGARTVWPVSEMVSSYCASAWPSGMGKDSILKERMFGLTRLRNPKKSPPNDR